MDNRIVIVLMILFVVVGYANAQDWSLGITSNFTNVVTQKLSTDVYADQYTDIATAINALNSTRVNAETVIINGDYKVSSLITIPDNTILDFTNANITWTGAGGAGTKIFTASGRNIVIKGGRFCMNSADYAFWLSGEDLKVIGGNYSCFVSGSGLFRVTGKNIEITGVKANGEYLGIGINGLDGAENVSVHHNQFFNFNDNAIDFGTAGAGTIIKNIHHDNNLIVGGGGGGISFYSNVRNAEATNNMIIDKGSRCFRVSDQGFGTPTNIKISGNTCINQTYANVWLQGSNETVIEGNNFISYVDPSESGILFDTRASNNTTIKNNVLRMKMQDTHIAIRINAGFANNLTIVDNDIFGGAAGISVANVDFSEFSNNKIFDQWYYALEIINSRNNTMLDNFIQNTLSNAVQETGISDNNLYIGTVARHTGGCLNLLASSQKQVTYCNGQYTS